MFVGNNDLIGKKAPELIGAGPWINATARQLRDDLPNHPLLVTFLTSTDLNSLRALPVLNAWHQQYSRYDLTIIGVHVPDFGFERSLENMAGFFATHGVTFPVLLDNQSVAAEAFGCYYRPSFCLVDAEGVVRYVQAGEGEAFALERLIRELLREGNVTPVESPVVGPEGERIVCFHPTPRLYCGYARGQIGNGQEEVEGRATMYTDSGDYEEGRIYLQGVWLQGQECVRHARQTATPVDYLAVRYRAGDVQAVMGATDGQPVSVLVSRDGVPLPPTAAGRDVAMVDGESWVTVAEPRLYALIADVAFGSHVLRLSAYSQRLEIYALAFCGSLQKPALGHRAA